MEELNQTPTEELTIDSQEDEGLFDDYAEETEDTPAEVTEAQPTEQVEPFITIRYNKEDKGLSRDEAIELSQKGMNYDKLKERYDSLNSELERLAKSNEMDVQTYLKGLNDAQTKLEVSREVSKLKEKYPNSSNELLEELARKNISERTETTNREQVDAQQHEIEKQIEVFNRRYPNLEADKLDPGVYEYMKDGYSLLESYNIWKEEQLSKTSKEEESQAKIDRLNEDNRSKSLGNINSNGTVETDDFLSGFLNA